ncbi:MAG TPA: hypothetical protein VNM69_03800 [Bacillus sp. (in: firmicutes)]|nr:hypothetical protein [Bacillus sp. (in: firmicutes)]
MKQLHISMAVFAVGLLVYNFIISPVILQNAANNLLTFIAWLFLILSVPNLIEQTELSECIDDKRKGETK